MAISIVTQADVQACYPGVHLDGFVPTHVTYLEHVAPRNERRTDFVTLGESEDGIRYGYIPGQSSPRFAVLSTGIWQCLDIHGIVRAEEIKYDPFWVSPLDLDGYVYFIEAGPDGPIKIGWSQDVASRLAQLQVANAHKLRLLGVIPGTMRTERQTHKLFRHMRMEAEWFRNVPEIQEYIRKFCQRESNAEPIIGAN